MCYMNNEISHAIGIWVGVSCKQGKGYAVKRSISASVKIDTVWFLFELNNSLIRELNTLSKILFKSFQGIQCHVGS